MSKEASFFGADVPGGLGPFLQRQGVVILDGGLASELEARGCDLDDPLWSARVLLERPELIRAVHLAYLEAGADCLITASYQASLPGLAAAGLDDGEAEAVLRRSVDLAVEARELFWSRLDRRSARLRPLVAASVGPYGAFLADGSEFRGRYGLGEAELVAFHRPRLEVLATAGADLLACETVPAALEARVLGGLVAELKVPAWLSFSCRDGSHISDGTPIRDAVAEVEGVSQLVAVGVNCTPPSSIAGLLGELAPVTGKPIVVYPNSGELYDTRRRRWTGSAAGVELAPLASRWHQLGARLIGGCCRTTPSAVSAFRRALLGPPEEAAGRD